MNDTKPTHTQNSKPENGLLLDHNYDGIQELDNPLPSWWLWTFYLTIIFGTLYTIHYMSGSGPDSKQELSMAMEELKEIKGAHPDAPITDEMIISHLKTAESIAHGHQLFQGKCAACHGDNGQGFVGPNLTDDFWIHGNGTPSEVAKVIQTGVLEKGMPNWSATLSQEEIIDVAAFVRSIHGTNPKGAKPPQGEKQPFKEL